MRKLLVTVLSLFLSSQLYAETLTPDMIKEVHNQVKQSFNDGCSEGAKGDDIKICACLADKAQSYLDDKALSLCTNDKSGTDCVTKAVKDASMKASSKDNIAECKKTVASNSVAETPSQQ